jgi:hypothetical protein
VNLTSDDNSPAVAQIVTLKMVVDKKGAGFPSPTGTVTFFDGDTAIVGCSNVAVAVIPGPVSSKRQALCVTSWPIWGTRHIASVYYGDAVYKPVGDVVTITIAPPAGSGAGPVTIDTTGTVKLYGPTSGPFSGLTIFQDKLTANTVTVAPGLGVTPCTLDWLTRDVPHVVGPPAGVPPVACGALGGIRGTVYAPNEDSLVLIESSGLADLQIISGRIQINNDADTRFAYTPGFFANGKIHLVE